VVYGGGYARWKCGRGRGHCSLRSRRSVRPGAGGCRVGANCCGSDGGGGSGGGDDGVEANIRRRISSLNSCCGLNLRLQSGRAGVANGFCGAGVVRRDGYLVGAVVVASAVVMDNSLLAVFVGKALSLFVVGAVSQDMFGGESSHEIVYVVVVAVVVLEAAQSTMEAACSHTMVPRMVVDIGEALVAATGMGWVVGSLEAHGQLASLDSILVLP
jgi:hypothetical protein